MTMKKSQIAKAVKAESEVAQAYIEAHPQAIPQNGMIPCVYIQQVSARRYDVGWRYTKAETVVGEVQSGCGTAFNRDQTIAWVWPLSQKEKEAAILKRWGLQIEVIFMGKQETFTRQGGVGNYPCKLRPP